MASAIFWGVWLEQNKIIFNGGACKIFISMAYDIKALILYRTVGMTDTVKEIVEMSILDANQMP